MSRRLPLIIAAFLLALAGEINAAEQVLWRDAMGRDVSLTVPAARIVSLAPSATETLFAIGADAFVVGVSRHCDFPVAAKLKPKVGDFNGPDLEKVRAAAPDVVLFTEFARASDLAALETFGIAALVLPAKSVDNVLETIGRLGALTGRAAAADALAAEIGAALAEIGARITLVPEAGRPRVYVEVDGPQKLYAVGPASFMDDLVRRAGGRNVFSERKAPYFPVESAEVVAADPDVVLIDYPFQYKVGVARRPGWDAVAAVRNGRVYDGTDYDIIVFNRPGPRIARALRGIAALLHPDLFRER